MADKYATRGYCVNVGGWETTQYYKLVLKQDLPSLNCSLVASPSKQYVDNQCVLQKDIKLAEGTSLSSAPDLISATLESELSIGIDKTAYYSYNEGGYSNPTYSGGIDFALSSSLVRYNLGYWVQGGSVETEYDNHDKTISRLIKLQTTITIITTEYWDYNPADNSIPQAFCQLIITYEDNSTQSPLVNYTRTSCEPYGQPQNGKYKYIIEFENTHPHIETNNKKIKAISVTYSLYGGA